jgi:hypothetical protein
LESSLHSQQAAFIARRALRQLLRISTNSRRQMIEQLATDFGLRELFSEVLLESDEIE